ncbi:MAG: formate dehydrogenase subunit gamma [Gammaproteobacteria bacterium]
MILFRRLVLGLFLCLLLPALYSLTALTQASDADGWRKIREGAAGYSAVKGQETGVLIQGSGQNWRRLRNGPVATYGGWLLALTAAGLGCFFMIRGQVKLNRPRSGEMIVRWSLAERLLHWFTATVFLILMLTGFSLLYGRALLIPLVGHANFSGYAGLAKAAHNYLGPLFIAGLLLMFAAWAKDNLPRAVDIEWFKAFGGLIGDRHPPAGRMNGGEKAWFWLLMVAGFAVSLTGLALDFTQFGQDRWLLQISHLVHAVSALLLSAGALGHIYIGTIGTEGAYEGMKKGKVDATWAQQHHDLWYEEIQAPENRKSG